MTAVVDRPALTRLTGDASTFLARCWEQRPFLRRGEPHGWRDLMSLEDLDAIITCFPLRTPLAQMVFKGRPVDPRAFTTGELAEQGAPIDPRKVQTLLGKEATLLLYKVNSWWLPLARFSTQLEADLQHPTSAVVFLTPGGEGALEVHTDAREVFALQVEGRKEWTVWKRPADRRVGMGSFEPSQLGEPILEDTLEVGDCLYVPRGCPHFCRPLGETSAHVAVIVHSVLVSDVLRSLAEQLCRSLELDVALPAAFHDEALGLALERVSLSRDTLIELLAKADLADIIALGVEQYERDRRHLVDGDLVRLARERRSNRTPDG